MTRFDAKHYSERGKSAEKAVDDLLTEQGSRDFVHWRLPDARAGSLKPTLADFLVLREGRMMLLEVKEVDHPYRLPYKNFKVDKVSRMRRFALAGAATGVLVRHTPTGLWRVVPFAVFVAPRNGASWDLSEYEATSLDVAVAKLWSL